MQVAPELSQEQIVFRYHFMEDILRLIMQDEQTYVAQKDHIKNIKVFTASLQKKGLATIEGEDKNCRPVAVTVQAAFEAFLSRELSAENVRKVKVLTLNPGPYTPFMKEGVTKGLTSEPFEHARQHTLDYQEFTLKNLRDSGAKISVAYSKAKYEELKKNSKTEAGIAIYDKEITNNLVDTPLKENVPAKLVGTLYEFLDKKNGKWILVTREISTLEAKAGVWKMRLAPANVDSKAKKRADNMKAFVQQHKLK